MLGTLIKHEWKALTKVFLPFNILLLLITAIGCLTLHNIDYDSDNFITRLVLSFGAFFYILALITVSCGALIYLFVRYYRTMYSDEGYLTNTLPLSTHTLIIGKTLTASFWLFITYTLTIASVLLLVGTIPGTNLLGPGLSLLIDTYNQYSSISFGLLTFLCVMEYLISLIFSVLFMYTSMAIGQLFNKHKIIGSIAAYFILYTVLQVVTTVTLTVSGMIGYLAPETPEGLIRYFHTAFLIDTVIVLIFGAIFYYLSYILTRRKLNLD